MAAPLQGRGQSEANLLGHFECSVCLEMSEKPVQLPCECIFCPEFLQECLKPKKPLCPVLQRPGTGVPAWGWEDGHASKGEHEDLLPWLL